MLERPVQLPQARSSIPMLLQLQEYANSPLLLKILRIAVDLFEILAR